MKGKILFSVEIRTTYTAHKENRLYVDCVTGW